MMGMTVQAVRVLLATAIIESSSSSLVTSPSSLSFSAFGEIFRNWERNIARPGRPGNYLNIDEFLLDLQQPGYLLLRLLQAPLQFSSRTNLSRGNLTDWLGDNWDLSPHLGDGR